MDKKETVRLFVAVDMPAEIIDQAIALQEHLKKANVFGGNYTGRAGMHCTLKFLGDVNILHVPAIEAALAHIRHRPMAARAGAVDVFYAGSMIKVIYQHIICPELSELVARIEQALEPFAAKEQRGFIGHLTLARVKKVDDRQKLLDVVNGLTPLQIPCVIDQFVLRSSQLSSEGPLYKDLGVFPLR